MTPEEAGQLLAAAAAFDNRKASVGAAHGWAAALPDVPLDQDTLTAVARYYGTPPRDPETRLWLEPHHVRTLRAKIRAERLANFVYEPAQEESPRQFVSRLRQQLRAVGDGRQAPAQQAPALTGAPHPSVVRALAGVGRPVPGEGEGEGQAPQVPRPGPLGVECPTCRALIGRPCRMPSGRGTRPPHSARVSAARGEALPDPAAQAAEIARRQEISRRKLADADAEQEAS